jgi:hypothetical protein
MLTQRDAFAQVPAAVGSKPFIDTPSPLSYILQWRHRSWLIGVLSRQFLVQENCKKSAGDKSGEYGGCSATYMIWRATPRWHVLCHTEETVCFEPVPPVNLLVGFLHCSRTTSFFSEGDLQRIEKYVLAHCLVADIWTDRPSDQSTASKNKQLKCPRWENAFWSDVMSATNSWHRNIQRGITHFKSLSDTGRFFRLLFYQEILTQT